MTQKCGKCGKLIITDNKDYLNLYKFLDGNCKEVESVVNEENIGYNLCRGCYIKLFLKSLILPIIICSAVTIIVGILCKFTLVHYLSLLIIIVFVLSVCLLDGALNRKEHFRLGGK